MTLSFKKQRSLVSIVVLITVLIVITFAPGFGGFFMYDDYVLLSQAMSRWSITHPGTFFAVSQNGLFTPFNNLLFWLEFQLFGLNYTGYQFTSILFHLLNSLLVVSIAALLTKNKFISVVAGIIFAVGFSYYEATSWVAAYVHLVTAFFYLGTIALFLLWQETSLKWIYILSLFSFTLGLFSKEPIVTLPAILFLGLILLNNSKRSNGYAAYLYPILPFIILGGIYVVGMYLWQKFAPNTYFLNESVFGIGKHNLTNFQYLAHLIYPSITPSFIARLPIPYVLEIYNGVFFLFFILFTLFLIYFLWRGEPLFKYSVIWILITFIPFTFITVGMASRYLYLPAVGWAILAAGLLHKLSSRWPGKKWMYAIVLLYIIVNMSLFYVWQLQMNRNGQTRRMLINQIATQRPGWPEDAILCVEQLHPKFWDVRWALPLWMTEPPDFKIVDASDNCEVSNSKNVYNLVYDQGILVAK